MKLKLAQSSNASWFLYIQSITGDKKRVEPEKGSLGVLIARDWNVNWVLEDTKGSLMILLDVIMALSTIKLSMKIPTSWGGR